MEKEAVQALKDHYKKGLTIDGSRPGDKPYISIQYIEKMLVVEVYEKLERIERLLAERNDKSGDCC